MLCQKISQCLVIYLNISHSLMVLQKISNHLQLKINTEVEDQLLSINEDQPLSIIEDQPLSNDVTEDQPTNGVLDDQPPFYVVIKFVCVCVCVYVPWLVHEYVLCETSA